MDNRTAALATLLTAANWRAADDETRRLLVGDADVGGFKGVDAEEAANIDCTLLDAIDTAWSTASGGRFGLTVQRQVLDVVVDEGFTGNETWRQFGRRVGWVHGSEWIGRDEVRYELEAPEGHLPWVPAIGTVVNTGRVYEAYVIFYNRIADCLG